jgi:hypothetical protein
MKALWSCPRRAHSAQSVRCRREHRSSESVDSTASGPPSGSATVTRKLPELWLPMRRHFASRQLNLTQGLSRRSLMSVESTSTSRMLRPAALFSDTSTGTKCRLRTGALPPPVAIRGRGRMAWWRSDPRPRTGRSDRSIRCETIRPAGWLSSRVRIADHSVGLRASCPIDGPPCPSWAGNSVGACWPHLTAIGRGAPGGDRSTSDYCATVARSWPSAPAFPALRHRPP